MSEKHGEISQSMGGSGKYIQRASMSDDESLQDMKTSGSSTFNTSLNGATIANFANQVSGSARQQANQYVYSTEQRKTLAEAAEEIQKLLKQLEISNPNAMEHEKIAYVNNATNPNFKSRVVSALQAGSETAIEQFLDNPYINVGKAIVKGWLKPERSS